MLEKLLFGNLTLDAIPLHVPILVGTASVLSIAVIAILALITVNHKWKYLWDEWLTSLDHKKIGIMYLILAMVMMLRGFSDAVLMRSQQAIAAGHAAGYLPPEHYDADQIFQRMGSS